MKSLVITLISTLGISLLLLALAIVFGGPKPIPALASISQPFNDIDYSDLPQVSYVNARDGQALAYRTYASLVATSGEDKVSSVVLVHGSSASSQSMHKLAVHFQQAGLSVYALDIRGHGESVPLGKINYLGQLEDDLEDFMLSVKPKGIKILVGFSSGGGFALRFAGSGRQAMFDNYLLLSPFISQDSPASRNNSGGWVSVGVPRLVGIGIVKQLGINNFNDLAVMGFALNKTEHVTLTYSYNYDLAMNFRPLTNYQDNIAAVTRPMAVLVGEDDELFYPEAFAPLFATNAQNSSTDRAPNTQLISVTMIPKLGHIDMILAPEALKAALEAVEQF
jgi:non-heme chloroperoxidase